MALRRLLVEGRRCARVASNVPSMAGGSQQLLLHSSPQAAAVPASRSWFSSRSGAPPPPPRSPGGPAGGQATQQQQQQQQQQRNPPPPPPPASADKSGASKDVSAIEVTGQNFDALIRSPVPVILDCYADWCDPCRKLAPVLEAEVKKHQGRLLLAKLNADELQELAAQLQVRSLPTVFGIAQGKLVDMFVGLPSEQQLSSFINKLLSASPVPAAEQKPSGPEAELSEADELAKDPSKGKEAAAVYKRVYEALAKESQPSPLLQARCLAGLAKCALVSGARNEAQQLVAALKSSHQAEIKAVPDIAATLSFVELGLSAPAEEEGVSAAETLKKLQEEVSGNPSDLEAKHRLALKLFQMQRFEEAVDQELEILKRDKAWNSGAASQLILKIIEALGPGHPLGKKARSRMTNLLFL